MPGGGRQTLGKHSSAACRPRQPTAGHALWEHLSPASARQQANKRFETPGPTPVVSGTIPSSTATRHQLWDSQHCCQTLGPGSACQKPGTNPRTWLHPTAGRRQTRSLPSAESTPRGASTSPGAPLDSAESCVLTGPCQL